VALGVFTAPPQLGANPKSLSDALRQELAALKVEDVALSEYGISGEVRPVRDATTRLVALELKVKIVDAKNQPLHVLNGGLFDLEAMTAFLGANTELPLPADAKARGDKLWADLRKPPVH